MALFIEFWTLPLYTVSEYTIFCRVAQHVGLPVVNDSKQSLSSFRVRRTCIVFKVAMLLLPVLVSVLLLSTYSEAHTCESIGFCSPIAICTWGYNCTCPEGHTFYRMCETKYSCTSECPEITGNICVPNYFCSAKGSTQTVKYCNSEFSIECTEPEDSFITYRRYFSWFMLVCSILYLLMKYVCRCDDKPTNQTASV